MRKINWQKWICTIAFTGIMIIDWTRGSLIWHYWAEAINLTGVILAVVMACGFTWKKQSIWKYLLWIAVWAAGTGAGYLIWRNAPGTVFEGQYFTAALSVGALGVIAVRMFQEKDFFLAVRRRKRPMVVLTAALAFLMTTSRSGEIWPVWFFFMFGMFYLIRYSPKESEALWETLADGVIIGFFLIQSFAFGFRPYDVVRYSGAYANCNMNALFYIVTYIMVLYKLHCLRLWDMNAPGRKNRRFLLIFYGGLAGGLFNLTLFTISRTAFLVIVGVTFIYAGLEFVMKKRMQTAKFVRMLVGGCLTIVLTFPLVYLCIRYLPTILHHPVWWEGEYSTDKVHSFDPPNSDKYVSLEEFFSEFLGRMSLINAGREEEISLEQEKIYSLFAGPVSYSTALAAESVSADAGLLQGSDADSSGKIRIEIFKKYMEGLNFLGHSPSEGYFQITETYHSWHAQNVFLQIAFFYGIPAGLCFVVLIVWIGKKALLTAYYGEEKHALLPFLVWLVFVGFGMLECVWYPGQSILFLICLTPKIWIDAERKQLT